jgi:tRNA 5-methylaminomethyl-2-thiouridine biosynthesis bifunctional protein
MDASAPLAWGGYAIPTGSGLLFGATHDRDDEGAEVRPEDTRRNLATLAACLPRRAVCAQQAPLRSRAAVRATTPDRLPVAGRVEEGLYVLGGLGSRGFCLAPLLAEHVTAQVLQRPSPLGAGLAQRFAPSRLRAFREPDCDL